MEGNESYIYDRLEQLRLKHNLQLHQFCAIMEIDPAGYKRLSENPLAALTISQLAQLHNQLNASADFILFGIEPMLVKFDSPQAPETRQELDSIKLHIKKLRDQIRPENG